MTSENTTHTELLNRTGTQIGKIMRTMKRYCAACQTISECYIVRWPDGSTTRPCTSGCKINTDGKLQIC